MAVTRSSQRGQRNQQTASEQARAALRPNDLPERVIPPPPPPVDPTGGDGLQQQVDPPAQGNREDRLSRLEQRLGLEQHVNPADHDARMLRIEQALARRGQNGAEDDDPPPAANLVHRPRASQVGGRVPPDGNWRRNPEDLEDDAEHEGNSETVGKRLDEEVRRLNQRLDDLAKGKKLDELDISTKHPFTAAIMEEPLPGGFSQSHFEPYDGKADPVDHLHNFKCSMVLHGACDAIMCRSFPSTLKGVARTWYTGLKPESIHSFDQLSRQFLAQFASSRKQRKTSESLMLVRQEQGESLRDYLARFTAATMEIADLNHDIARAAITSGLRPSKFLYSIAENPPIDYQELVDRANNHVRAEDTLNAWRAQEARMQPSKRQKGDDGRSRNDGRSRDDPRSRTPRRDEHLWIQSNGRKFEHYTPLNTSRTHILDRIKGELWFRFAEKLKSPPERRDKKRVCGYHRDFGHDTEECFALKDLIESQIREGSLHCFVADNERKDRKKHDGRDQDRGRSKSRDLESKEPTRVINMISGGLTGGGTSNL